MSKRAFKFQVSSTVNNPGQAQELSSGWGASFEQGSRGALTQAG